MSLFDSVTDLAGHAGSQTAFRQRERLRQPVAIPVTAQEWDWHLRRFDDVSYNQTAVYTAGKWGAARVCQCIVMHGRDLLGGACVTTFVPPFLRQGLAYINFGPVWRRSDLPPAEERYRAVVTALYEEYALRRGHLLSIVPRASPDFSPLEYRALTRLGFRLRRPSLDPERYLVDLALDPDQQWNSLGQKWRYNLRKALASSLRVCECSGEQGYVTIAELHRQMVARKRFDNKDAVDLLTDMAERLAPEHGPRTFLVHHGDHPVAGAVIGCLGDTAYYLFGASSAEALPLRAGYALQWHVVTALRHSGQRWYDLGGSARDDGLRQFKLGLVGRRGVVHAMPGEFDRWSGQTGRLIAGGIYRLRAAMRLKRAFGL
jgi:hypothetical protein